MTYAPTGSPTEEDAEEPTEEVTMLATEESTMPATEAPTLAPVMVTLEEPMGSMIVDGDALEETMERMFETGEEKIPEAKATTLGCKDRSRVTCEQKAGCEWNGIKCKRESNDAGRMVPPVLVGVLTTLAIFAL